jgi:hypothetical protein
LQQKVATGRYTSAVAILLGTAAWAGGYVLHDEASWLSVAGGYATYLLAGLMLVSLNNAYSLLRSQPTLPLSLFFLLVAACVPLHQFTAEAAACVLFLLAVYSLFGSYQQPHPAGALFYTFVFLGMGSMFFPRMVLLVPLFLLGAYQFRSLTWKSVAGSVVGWFLPYWFLLVYALMKADMALLVEPLERMVAFGPLPGGSYQPWEWAVMGYLLVFYLISIAHLFTSGFEGKVSTRSYLVFFGWLNLFVFVYMVLQPADVPHLLPFLLIGTGVLMSNYIATTGSVVSNVIFIVAWAGLFCLYGYNLMEAGWI